MVAAKKKRSRQGMFSKIANAGLIALGFSGALTSLVEGGVNRLVADATLGFVRPGQAPDLNPANIVARALKVYVGPGIAAGGLCALKSYLLRKFPVRR